MMATRRARSGAEAWTGAGRGAGFTTVYLTPNRGGRKEIMAGERGQDYSPLGSLERITSFRSKWRPSTTNVPSPTAWIKGGL